MNQRICKKFDADGAGSGSPVYEYLVWQGSQPLLNIFDADGLGSSGSSPVVIDSYLNGLGQTLADYQPDIGAVWLTTNNEGTVGDLVFFDPSSGSYVVTHRLYDSFGNVQTIYPYYVNGRLVDTIIGFQGSVWDADVGLCFMGATPYDPSVGRFVRQDQTNPPPDLNSYRAFGNSPVDTIDPTGRCSQGLSSSVNNVWNGIGSGNSVPSGIAYYTGTDYDVYGNRTNYSPSGATTITPAAAVAAEYAASKYQSDTQRASMWNALNQVATQATLGNRDPGAWGARTEDVRQQLAADPELGAQVIAAAADRGYFNLGGASVNELLNSPGQFRGFMTNGGVNILAMAQQNNANIQLENPWAAGAAAIPGGLRTGLKANVNGLSQAGASAISFGYWNVEGPWAVNDYDRSIGYDTAVQFSRAGGNILIGVATGQAAGFLSQGGQAAQYASMGIRAFDATRNGFDVGRGAADAYNNGLSVQNSLQMVGGGLGMVGDFSGITRTAKGLSTATVGGSVVDPLESFAATRNFNSAEEAQKAWSVYQKAAASPGILIGHGEAPIQNAVGGWYAMRMPQSQWTWEVNKAFLDGAIDAGRPVGLVTPFTNVVRGSVTWREINHVVSRGGQLIIR